MQRQRNAVENMCKPDASNINSVKETLMQRRRSIRSCEDSGNSVARSTGLDFSFRGFGRWTHALLFFSRYDGSPTGLSEAWGIDRHEKGFAPLVFRGAGFLLC
jgi:hypothetical protein